MLKFSKAHLYQNLLGLAILIVVGLICWPLSPQPKATPAGIFLPAGPLKTAISPSKVQILEVMPPHATIMGTIHTKLYYPKLSTAEEKHDLSLSLSYAKTLAAKAGANGVVPIVVGTTGIANPLDGFIVEAKAVSY